MHYRVWDVLSTESQIWMILENNLKEDMFSFWRWYTVAGWHNLRGVFMEIWFKKLCSKRVLKASKIITTWEKNPPHPVTSWPHFVPPCSVVRLFEIIQMRQICLVRKNLSSLKILLPLPSVSIYILTQPKNSIYHIFDKHCNNYKCSWLSSHNDCHEFRF